MRIETFFPTAIPRLKLKLVYVFSCFCSALQKLIPFASSFCATYKKLRVTSYFRYSEKKNCINTGSLSVNHKKP